MSRVRSEPRRSERRCTRGLSDSVARSAPAVNLAYIRDPYIHDVVRGTRCVMTHVVSYMVIGISVCSMDCAGAGHAHAAPRNSWDPAARGSRWPAAPQSSHTVSLDSLHRLSNDESYNHTSTCGMAHTARHLALSLQRQYRQHRHQPSITNVASATCGSESPVHRSST